MKTNKSCFLLHDLMMLSAETLVFILAFNILSPIQAFAQNECATALIEAQKMYDMGRFNKTIELLLPCLPDRIPTKESVQAYRLLALAYLAEDYRDKAEEAVEKLLKLDRYYEANAVLDPQQFIELVEKVKKRLGQPFVKLIKLNVGYPLWLPKDNIVDFYTNGFITGFELLWGKKILIGFSYDHVLFNSQSLRDKDGMPIYISYIDYKARKNFYSFAIMYKLHSFSKKRELVPFGSFKLGLVKGTLEQNFQGANNVNDRDRFTYSLTAGVNIQLKSSLHSFISLDYSSTPGKSDVTPGLEDNDLLGILLYYAKSYLAIKSGIMVYF